MAGLRLRVIIRYDWLDRLRILFHGCSQLSVAAHTEHEPGKVGECTSKVTARRISRRQERASDLRSLSKVERKAAEVEQRLLETEQDRLNREALERWQTRVLGQAE